jgi:hypothetical protein
MQQVSETVPLPSEIRDSPIFANGGFIGVSEVFPEDCVAALYTEAVMARQTGQRNVLAEASPAENRGGSPARAFTSAQAGLTQWGIFSAPPILAGLARICGLTTTPTGSGSYTYYEESGAFLSLHRDIETCDLTVITCLKETGVGLGDGSLVVYSQHWNEPLSAAIAAGTRAGTAVRIARAESVALLGGVVPHEVTAMQPGQERIVSVMCYRVLLNGTPFS